MSARSLFLVLVIASACADNPVTTSEASTTADPTTDDPTDDPTTATTTATTTDPTTGPALADPCDPALPAIPEAEFAARYAATICQQKTDCGCTVPGSCALDFVDGFQLIHSDGQNLGLTYDGDCAARKLAGLVHARGCKSASTIDPNPSCTLDCLVYRGAIADGAACDRSSVALTTLFADKCAAPNSCSADVCTAPLATVDIGQPCVTPVARCKANAGCDVLGSKTCEPIVGEDKDCSGNGVCRPDLFCGPANTCTPRGAAGATCAKGSECASFRCTTNKCEDWVWICEVAEEIDIFGRHPGDF